MAMIMAMIVAVIVTMSSPGAALAAPDPAGSAAAGAPPIVAGAASAPAATHRPLRSNRPVEGLPAPTDPEVFTGYPGAPAHAVVPRKDQLQLYPCSQCHKVLPVNPTPRKLVAAPHSAALAHGRGRMWCLDCHMGTDRDALRTISGARIDFNDSHMLCAQCHSARHKDWTFGAHGKRVGQWLGETRQLYSCTHCHDPHNPLVQPRAASKPPPVRAGLLPMQTVIDHVPALWQYMQPSKEHAR